MCSCQHCPCSLCGFYAITGHQHHGLMENDPVSVHSCHQFMRRCLLEALNISLFFALIRLLSEIVVFVWHSLSVRDAGLERPYSFQDPLRVHPCKLECVIPDAYGPGRSTATLSGSCQLGSKKVNGLIGGNQFNGNSLLVFEP